jgi:hypothetical protein
MKDDNYHRFAQELLVRRRRQAGTPAARPELAALYDKWTRRGCKPRVLRRIQARVTARLPEGRS